MQNRKVITVLELLTVFIILPVCIFAVAIFLPNINFYLTSSIVAILAVIIFFFEFEGGKPRVSELVTIAVMTALAVAGRAAFYMLPQVKPMMAIVVVTAAVLGAQSGFVCGAITAFVSNFFFGQGPWTVWQMLAMGISGYLCGIIFSKVKINRLSLCIAGGFSTLVIYGVLVDFSSFLMYTGTLDITGLVTTLSAGLPFNLMHTAATIVFLLLAGIPIAKKLNRLKDKFGIFRAAENNTLK